MKINNPLDKILDNESNIRVLRFLFRTNAEWNGRQIAKEVGLAPATAHKALRNLNKEGVLVLRNMGKAYVYTLNKNNFVVTKMLAPLFMSEDKMLEYIFGIIHKGVVNSKIKRSIVSVVLFGSVNARKDNTASDIDLAVIVDDLKTKHAAELLFEGIDAIISKEFGNTVSAYINTKREFQVNYKKGLPITVSIVKTNKFIYGIPVEKIL